MNRQVDLVFDSGAFSAYKRNESISVEEYSDFLAEHKGHLDGYVSLDVIPGKPGQPKTQKQVEEAAVQGWRYYTYMKHRRGLDPIPVFHCGEDLRHLHNYLDAGCTHLGLGGVANARDDVRQKWLDEVFSVLCGDKGYPAVKVHGFGVTSLPMVYRYPWASTDSVSWFTYSNYGHIIVPKPDGKGGYDYGRPPNVIGMSRGSESGLVHSSHLEGRHFDVLGKAEKQYVVQYLKEEGFDVKAMQASWKERDVAAVRFYRRAAERHPMLPFSARRQGLFGGRARTLMGRPKPLCPYNMMFTVNTSHERSAILQQEGVRYRLLSYYYFQGGKRPVRISSYVRTGLIRRRVRLKEN
jgi:hypothetical protein